LVIARTDNITIANVISGTGGVTIQGYQFPFINIAEINGFTSYSGQANNITLTAINSYTGATIVGPGFLALSGAGSISASSQVNLTAYGVSQLDISGISGQVASIKALAGHGNVILGSKTLAITVGGATFDGGIYGAGSLTITGNNENLAGDDGYTGGTILGPNIVLNVHGSLALGTGLVTFSKGSKVIFGSGAVYTQDAYFNAGAPIFDTGGNTVTWTGQFSGPGDLAVTGGGTLILTNITNSYAGGTEIYGNAALQIGADSELGAVAPLRLGDATSNGTLQFASGFNLDPTRTITLNAGGGTIDTQAFNTTISQVIGGTGGLTKAGSGTLTLSANNNYTGPTNVNAGTLLVTGSTGSGAVTVGSGGTLGGTGLVGATTVASGGTIAPGVSGIGTLHTGALTLAAGSVTAIDLTPTAADQIVASGAASLGGTLALAPAAGTYTAGTDYRLVSATSVSGAFSGVTGSGFSGLVPNVRYSATGADLILNYPFTNYASTLNQTAVATVLNASPAGSGTANALGNVVAANPAAVPAALNQLAGDIHASLRSAAIEGDRVIRNSVLARLGEKAEDGLAVWASGFGGYGSIRSDGNAAGVHQDTAGFIAGADMPLGVGFRAGVAGAYISQNVHIAQEASHASGGTGHVVGYANWSNGTFDINLGGDYGWGSNQVNRQITVLAETDSDHQSQRVGQVFGDAGYKITSDAAMVEPYADIAHVSATTGGFVETGGTSALSGVGKTDGETYSTLGMRASLANVMLEDWNLTPRIDLGWQHSFDTLHPGQTVTFSATGQSFNVLGVPLAVDAATVQVGVGMAIAPNAFLSLSYDGSFSSRVQDNGIEGRLAWRF
jgi:fibronectin-binding autotransporter adhesin